LAFSLFDHRDSGFLYRHHANVGTNLDGGKSDPIRLVVKHDDDLDFDAAAQRVADDWRLLSDRLDEVITLRESSDPREAAKGRRALANATFKQEPPARALALAKRQVTLSLAKHQKAFTAGVVAATEVSLAVSRVRSLEETEEARRAEMLDNNGGRSPPELTNLYDQLRDLGVTRSMLPLLTPAERKALAQLFIEKSDDPTHRNPNGAWMGLFRGGFTDIVAVGLTRDEADAVLISQGGEAEEGLFAMRYFNEAAGRDLKMSAQFALCLLRNIQLLKMSRGLQRTAEKISLQELRQDLETIIPAFGLDPDQIIEGYEIWSRFKAPKLAEFARSRMAAEAAQRTEENVYMPAARQLREKSEENRRARARTYQTEELDEPVDGYKTDPDHSNEDRDTTEAAATDRHRADVLGQAGGRGRSQSFLDDVELYASAMVRCENIEDREQAALLAQSEHARKFAKRKGVDVPEPIISSSREALYTPQSRAGREGEVPDPKHKAEARETAGLSRAERNRRMKGIKE